MREDLRKLDMLDEQSRFLAINGIDTIDDLNHFRSEAKDQLQMLDKRRNTFRNELKRVTRAADSEGVVRVKNSISEISEEMRQIRKSIKLCDSIEARSVPMAGAYEALSAEQDNGIRKEDNTHEREIQHL